MILAIAIITIFSLVCIVNFKILMDCYTPNYKEKGFVLIKTNQWEVR